MLDNVADGVVVFRSAVDNQGVGRFVRRDGDRLQGLFFGLAGSRPACGGARVLGLDAGQDLVERFSQGFSIGIFKIIDLNAGARLRGALVQAFYQAFDHLHLISRSERDQDIGRLEGDDFAGLLAACRGDIGCRPASCPGGLLFNELRHEGGDLLRLCMLEGDNLEVVPLAGNIEPA